jgi:hypothetical protein
MDEASVNGQKKAAAHAGAQAAAKRRQAGTFFWQTPMVQRFEIVCTATCASGWRNMPT